MSQTQEEKVAERFNSLVPLGTPMYYYPVGGAYQSDPQGPFPLTMEATPWNGSGPVVKLDGKSGVVALSHCTVAPNND